MGRRSIREKTDGSPQKAGPSVFYPQARMCSPCSFRRMDSVSF